MPSKSTLMGALGYLAVRRGIQTTLLDPSGPLARLGQMPELAPHTRVLNLYGAQRGTLAPYALIRTPQPDDFPTRIDTVRPVGDTPATGGKPKDVLEVFRANARAERRMLALDIAMMLLPPQHAGDSDVVAALRHAIRTVPAEETATLEDVIDALDDPQLGVAGKQAALLLGDAAELPLAALFFGQPPPGVLADTAPLTIITMGGLRLPDLGIERQYWSTEEALALPMLHAAHRLAVRRAYGGDCNRRKLVGLDEGHILDGWSSGRSFLVRLARDSRKWNIAALVASQNPRDILGLDVQNLVSTVFVGRIVDDPQIAAEALRLLRLPTGAGYEQTLAALSQHDPSDTSRLGFREFVMRDVDGRVQKIHVDVSYVDGLLDHLDTTPGGTR
jgi:AAA-like domain